MIIRVLNETRPAVVVAAASTVSWAVLAVPVSAQNPPKSSEPAPAPSEVSGDRTSAPAPNAVPSLGAGSTASGEWLAAGTVSLDLDDAQAASGFELMWHNPEELLVPYAEVGLSVGGSV